MITVPYKYRILLFYILLSTVLSPTLLETILTGDNVVANNTENNAHWGQRFLPKILETMLIVDNFVANDAENNSQR